MCEDAGRDKVCGLSSCHSICTVCKDAFSGQREKGNRVVAILEMPPILLLERGHKQLSGTVPGIVLSHALKSKL